MEGKLEREVSLKDIILKVSEWFSYLFSNRALVLACFSVGSIGGGLYAYWEEPTYVAEVSYVLESDTKSTSQYASLAALAGINVTSGGSSLFQGENIKDLMKSRLMIEQTLFTPIGEKTDENLLSLYLKFTGIEDTWAETENILDRSYFSKEKIGKDSLQDAVVARIAKDISQNNLSLDKKESKSSLSTVAVESENELFSKLFAEKLVANVSKFYVETKTNKSKATLALLEHQADSVRRELNNAIGGVASYNQSVPNANPVLQTIKVPSQRRQIDVQSNTAIFNELVKNIEVTRMTLRNETPLFQIVDTPVLPLEMKKLGILTGAILGGLLSMVLIVFVLLVKRLCSEVMAETL